LTKFGKAFFVDIDDDDRPLIRDPRLNDLEKIEYSDAKLFKEGRIGYPQASKRQQQSYAKDSGEAETARKFFELFHVYPNLAKDDGPGAERASNGIKPDIERSL
jgi:hypothetical protein